MNKAELRKELLARRDSLTLNEQMMCSISIVSLLRGFIGVNARNVLAYLPFRNEVDLSPFLDYLELQGIHIVLPKVVDKRTGWMEPLMVKGPWRTKVAAGAYGILEPAEGDVIDPQQLDLVLVPGVAYDRSFYRLGFGGGFYDRFLPRLSPQALKVGVAYEFQVLDIVPRDQHDIAMDALCTEEGLRKRDAWYKKDITRIT